MPKSKGKPGVIKPSVKKPSVKKPEAFQVSYANIIANPKTGMDTRLGNVKTGMSYALALCTMGESDPTTQDGMTLLQKNANEARSGAGSIATLFWLAGAICFARPILAAWERMKTSGVSWASIAEVLATVERIVLCGIPKIISMIPEVAIRTFICAPLDYLYTLAFDLGKKGPAGKFFGTLFRGLLFPFRQLAHRAANVISYAANLVTGIINLGIDLVRSVGWLASATAGAIYTFFGGKNVTPPAFADMIRQGGPLAEVWNGLGQVALNIARLLPELAVVGLLVFYPPAGVALASILGLVAAKLAAILPYAVASLLFPSAAVLAGASASQLLSLGVNKVAANMISYLPSPQAPKPSLEADTTKKEGATATVDPDAEARARLAERLAANRAQQEQIKKRAARSNKTDTTEEIELQPLLPKNEDTPTQAMTETPPEVQQPTVAISEEKPTTSSYQRAQSILAEHQRTHPPKHPEEIELQPLLPKKEDTPTQTQTMAKIPPEAQQPTTTPAAVTSTTTKSPPPLPSSYRLRNGSAGVHHNSEFFAAISSQPKQTKKSELQSGSESEPNTSPSPDHP